MLPLRLSLSIWLLMHSLPSAATDAPPLPAATFDSYASVVNFGGAPGRSDHNSTNNAAAELSYGGGFGMATGYSDLFFNYASSSQSTRISHTGPNLFQSSGSNMTVYFRISSLANDYVKIALDTFSQSIIAGNHDVIGYYDYGNSAVSISGVSSYLHSYCPAYTADSNFCHSGTDRKSFSYTLATNKTYGLTMSSQETLWSWSGMDVNMSLYTSASVSLLPSASKSFTGAEEKSDYTLEFSPGFSNQLNTSPVPEPLPCSLLSAGLLLILHKRTRPMQWLRKYSLWSASNNA